MNKELLKAKKLNEDRYREMKERNGFAENKAIDDYTKIILQQQRKEIYQRGFEDGREKERDIASGERKWYEK